MNRKEQERYLEVLGADISKITNKKEIDILLSELYKNSYLGVNSKEAKALSDELLKITDIPALKKLYKTKAKEHHPDKGGDAEEFKKIAHAYNMLTNPSYAFKSNKTSRNGPENLDVKVQVVLSFEQAFFGASANISVNPTEYTDGGEIKQTFNDDEPTINTDVFYLRIPEGTSQGTVKVIKEQGMHCGDRKGDLIITYVVKPHVKFTLFNTSIFSTEDIPLELLLTGGRIEILTMWGIKELVIPPGTKPFETLYIPKCGVAEFGDHEVKVNPIYPDIHALKSKSVWQRLNIKWGKDSVKNNH